jgi:hypothetical protein
MRKLAIAVLLTISMGAGLGQQSPNGATYTGPEGYPTYVIVTDSLTPYSIGSAEDIVACNGSSNNIVLDLPATSGSHRILLVKTNNTSKSCTATPAGSDTIFGKNAGFALSIPPPVPLLDLTAGTWLTFVDAGEPIWTWSNYGASIYTNQNQTIGSSYSIIRNNGTMDTPWGGQAPILSAAIGQIEYTNTSSASGLMQVEEGFWGTGSSNPTCVADYYLVTGATPNTVSFECGLLGMNFAPMTKYYTIIYAKTSLSTVTALFRSSITSTGYATYSNFTVMVSPDGRQVLTPLCNNSATNVSSSTGLSCTVSANAAVGDGIAVFVYSNGSSSVTFTASDSGSNTYTVGPHNGNSTNTNAFNISAAPVTTALVSGTGTITVKPSATTNLGFYAYDLSPAYPSSPGDVSQTTTGSSGTAVTTGSAISLNYMDTCFEAWAFASGVTFSFTDTSRPLVNQNDANISAHPVLSWVIPAPIATGVQGTGNLGATGQTGPGGIWCLKQ